MNPPQQERLDRADAIASKIWDSMPNFTKEDELSPEEKRRRFQARIANRIAVRAEKGETF